MARQTASQLLQTLHSSQPRPGVHFFLCDDPIFLRVARETLSQGVAPGETLATFSGKDALGSLVTHLSSGSLFGAPQPALLDATGINATQWKAAQKELERLPSRLDGAAYVFAPASARNVLKEAEASRWGSYSLTYPPDEPEARRALAILLSRYSGLKARDSQFRQTLIEQALTYYSIDLLAIDTHFERMEKLGVSFADALSGQTEVSVFDVIDALVSRDPGTMELRIRQVALAGEEPSRLLHVVASFLRQLVQVSVARERLGSLDAAFRSTGIPYPAQARIQKALGKLPLEAVARFFFLAPELERTLRGGRSEFGLLSAELLALISNK